jgi:Spy/CpxP family protein refolding chaperone
MRLHKLIFISLDASNSSSQDYMEINLDIDNSMIKALIPRHRKTLVELLETQLQIIKEQTK